jgi:hypothetical protein
MMELPMSDQEQAALQAQIDGALAQWGALSLSEKTATLQRAGILDENGQLAARYRGEDAPYEPAKKAAS